jgi:hypothetical protein
MRRRFSLNESGSGKYFPEAQGTIYFPERSGPTNVAGGRITDATGKFYAGH